jgi:anaerobic C4-dicarboxylate transporter
VIERLFLYVAVQQLQIAQRKEQRELQAMAMAEKQKEAREKEIDEGGKTALKIFVLFMLAIVVGMCLMSRPHGDEIAA